YHFDLTNAVPVGFSNGSNIAASMILHPDITFNKALLYAPLYPVDLATNKPLSNREGLLPMGENNPTVTSEDSQNVIDIFENRGGTVKQVWVNSHELTREGIIAGQSLLKDD